MSNTKPTKPQRDRFIETARELGCDEDEDRFNATLKRIAPKKGESQSAVDQSSNQNRDPED